jgi:hypothetical protein
MKERQYERRQNKMNCIAGFTHLVNIAISKVFDITSWVTLLEIEIRRT